MTESIFVESLGIPAKSLFTQVTISIPGNMKLTKEAWMYAIALALGGAFAAIVMSEMVGWLVT